MPRNGQATRDKIYEYLRQCAGSSFPTVREIAAACGLKSPSGVHAHLLALEQEGKISRQNGLARSVGVTERAASLIPLVGRVAAGVPITAVEHIEDYIPVPAQLMGEGDLFALRVVGDSMKNAGILNGDTVICRQCQTAENGEIVVALLDDEATVKRFFKEADRVVLQPENPDFAPIVAQQVMLLGKVVAVYRSYV